MTRAQKTTDGKILVSTTEEVLEISDSERAELLASLKQGEDDIRAGRGEILTAEILRAEFEGIFFHGKSDEELDAELAARAAAAR